MIKQLKKLFDWIRERKIKSVDIVLVVLLFVFYMLSVLCKFDITLDLDFKVFNY